MIYIYKAIEFAHLAFLLGTPNIDLMFVKLCVIVCCHFWPVCMIRNRLPQDPVAQFLYLKNSFVSQFGVLRIPPKSLYLLLTRNHFICIVLYDSTAPSFLLLNNIPCLDIPQVIMHSLLFASMSETLLNIYFQVSYRRNFPFQLAK